jgi:hypothetical protein
MFVIAWIESAETGDADWVLTCSFCNQSYPLMESDKILTKEEIESVFNQHYSTSTDGGSPLSVPTCPFRDEWNDTTWAVRRNDVPERRGVVKMDETQFFVTAIEEASF